MALGGTALRENMALRDTYGFRITSPAGTAGKVEDLYAHGHTLQTNYCC